MDIAFLGSRPPHVIGLVWSRAHIQCNIIIKRSLGREISAAEIRKASWDTQVHLHQKPLQSDLPDLHVLISHIIICKDEKISLVLYIIFCMCQDNSEVSFGFLSATRTISDIFPGFMQSQINGKAKYSKSWPGGGNILRMTFNSLSSKDSLFWL